MKPAPFALHRPEALKQAFALLATYQDQAKVIAGGQTLVPLMNFRLATPEVVIDLGRIEELKGIHRDGDRLKIGAMTRQCELLLHPLLQECAPLIVAAIPHIGHVQTRSKGTLGGSLAYADPAAELPLVMIALDAVMIVRSTDAERRVAAAQFFRDALTTDLSTDELLTHVELQAAAPGTRVAFREYARRHGDFALVSAAVQVGACSDGTRDVRAALGGVAAVPFRCRTVERLLARESFDVEAVTEALRADLGGCVPLSDIHGSGPYRIELAVVCLIDALSEAIQ